MDCPGRHGQSFGYSPDKQEVNLAYTRRLYSPDRRLPADYQLLQLISVTVPVFFY